MFNLKIKLFNKESVKSKYFTSAFVISNVYSPFVKSWLRTTVRIIFKINNI